VLLLSLEPDLHDFLYTKAAARHFSKAFPLFEAIKRGSLSLLSTTSGLSSGELPTYHIRELLVHHHLGSEVTSSVGIRLGISNFSFSLDV
jgi:hypothetical protein